MKRFLIIIVFLVNLSLPGQNFVLDQANINKNLDIYENGVLEYLPEIGFIKYASLKIDPNIYLYDLVDKKTKRISGVGNGPDQFKVATSVFSDGQFIFIQDLVKKKILKYDAGDLKLNDIISTKKMAKYNHGVMRYFLGKIEKKWIVYDVILKNPIKSKITNEYVISQDISIGFLNSDFSEYKQIYFIKGKGYPETCTAADVYVSFSNGNYYIVVLTAINFNKKLKMLKIPIINLKNNKVDELSVIIPDKYNYLQNRSNDYFMNWRIKLSKYKFIPWGTKFTGLDGKFYFCYNYYIDDDLKDILVNSIDFEKNKIEQFLIDKTKLDPLIADEKNIIFRKEMEETDDFKLEFYKKNKILKKLKNKN